MSDDSDDYKVGNKRPPKDTQFQKGRSGNPSGRPKGRKNVARMVNDIYARRVRVKGENGKTYYMSKLEAMVTQLVNNAAMKGEPRVVKESLEVLRMSPIPDPKDAPPALYIQFVGTEEEELERQKRGLRSEYLELKEWQERTKARDGK